MRQRENVLRMIDWLTIGLYLLLVVFGWFTIYAASYDFDNSSWIDFSARHGKQLIWIAFALAVFSYCSTGDRH